MNKLEFRDNEEYPRLNGRCGSHSHQEHPRTGYCFHCNTDNWEPENFRNI